MLFSLSNTFKLYPERAQRAASRLGRRRLTQCPATPTALVHFTTSAATGAVKFEK
jgi:hypothetical protein